ncbi:MAG TPA: signal peptidase I [Candidatus Eisenbacteria bacterium]|nr:signal peptidase I [Candidatus Eisenbacteria bacterium]
MKKFITFFTTTCLIIVVAVLILLSYKIGGMQAFIITSGSMEPTISTGSLAVVHTMYPSLLKQNDIITFIRPDNVHESITHRIYRILKKGSLTTFQTKGDANKNVDPWIVAGGGVIGKEFFTIPCLGYIFAFAKTSIGLMLLVALPALLLIYNEILTIFGLLKNNQKTANPTQTLLFLVLIGSSFLFFPSSFALVSDAATLTHNQFTVDIPSSHIVISNISYVGDEWVELYNPTDNDVDLKDWTLTNNSGNVVIIHANKFIAAKGFVVVTKDHSFFHKPEVDIIETGHTFGNGLDDFKDSVILKDAAGVEIDRMSWGQ